MIRLAGSASALAFALASSGALADPPCDGHYPSWGRVCSGGAHVTARTIEWYSAFSSCKLSAYEIIASDLESDKPWVAYRFKNRSKNCHYEVMEIAAAKHDNWGIKGYVTADDYKQRRDDPAAYLYCPVEPMPAGRCNLPLVRKDRK
ncbi:MAG: hypothetical protein J7605_22340 [Variovorax sp.]|nr:hypothetical protein [Variovorax sp.]